MPDTQKEKCGRCRGSGRDPYAEVGMGLGVCPDCNGTGEAKPKCESCSGLADFDPAEHRTKIMCLGCGRAKASAEPSKKAPSDVLCDLIEASAADPSPVKPLLPCPVPWCQSPKVKRETARDMKADMRRGIEWLTNWH